MSKVEETIADRDGRYGGFANVAETDCRLMNTLRSAHGWARLSYAQCVALQMIMHKAARIVNGDPDYADNWHDISGYATLVEKEIGK